ncbi:MAG TPA: ABC transporter permease [Acidimicrobiales bacterium]|nr:ABC transporter permease [Acidimicrobiales bacterium]
MSEFLSFTVLGIVFGAIYAITATGLVVTYTTTGVFNFAHGAVGMVAAFTYWQLWQAWHWPLLLALVVVLLVEAPLLGIAVEFVLMRRLYGASVDRSLMVTLGLLVILVGIATALWGSAEVIRSVPDFFENTTTGARPTIHLFGSNGVTIYLLQIVTVAVAGGIALGLRFFFRSLRLGIAMRAVVDDPELVAMSGADPFRISQMGWALGFFMAALAGVLLAPTLSTTGLSITQLTLLVVNGYAAAVVGRLRNLPLTFVGALALGLISEYAQAYLPGHVSENLLGVLPEVIPVAFLFLVLLVIPPARLAAAGRLPSTVPPRVASMGMSLAGSGAFVVAGCVLAAVIGATALATLSQGLALGIVGLSLVLLTGYAGQISLCQLTFMGVGAFAMGKLFGGASWWGMILAVVISGAVGALVALPAIRLRGLYLALATLAFGEAAFYAFFSNPSFIPVGQAVNVGRLPLPFVHGVSDRLEMGEVVVAAALCAWLVALIRRSRFGRRVVAMSDSPAAFATVGLSAVRTKVVVFAISAAMAGLGGIFYAGQQQGIGSDNVQFFDSLTLLLFVAIWGMRSVRGGILGGVTAAALPVLQTHLPASLADLTGLVAGVGIILLGRNPDGILGVPWLGGRLRVPFTGRGSSAPDLIKDVAHVS